jgi:hypothetical protein
MRVAKRIGKRGLSSAYESITPEVSSGRLCKAFAPASYHSEQKEKTAKRPDISVESSERRIRRRGRDASSPAMADCPEGEYVQKLVQCMEFAA